MLFLSLIIRDTQKEQSHFPIKITNYCKNVSHLLFCRFIKELLCDLMYIQLRCIFKFSQTRK